ncbi:MAG: phosphatase PAP2 family protein [Hyphomicrobiales bacterium]|nr:phosphatase PAP2 family protein [Hyphomicrobiales bacterium]
MDTAHRLDRIIWLMTGMVATIVLVAASASRFEIAWKAFLPPAIAAAVLTALAWVYRAWRPDARLAAGLTSTAQVIAFAAVGAPLSYIAASASLPLQDHAFGAIDRTLGFDWPGMLSWLNSSPTLYAVLRVIYQTLTLQMTTVVLCLAFAGELVRLRVYTLAFLIAALVCIAISAVLPGAGAWPHYGLTANASPNILPVVSTSWPVFDGLRDGSVRMLTAVGSEGIITFPSLHAALAIIVVMALWPIVLLRWLAIVLNGVMLVATPIDGSHYLIDVIAGVALALLSFLAAQRIAEMDTRRAPLVPRLAAED